MKLPPFARIPFVVSAVMLLAAGCALAPRGAPTPSVAAVSSSSPTSNATPTLIPTPTATSLPTEVPTAQPSHSPVATPTATLPWPEHNGRPPAGILTSGNDSIEGRGGSYCWGDTCADIPGWPSKAALPELDVASRDVTIRFSASKPVGFTEWYASYATGPSGHAKVLVEGGSPSDPDANSTPLPEFETFDFSPPSGDWIIYVSVYFRGGDLSYAWHVVVP